MCCLRDGPKEESYQRHTKRGVHWQILLQRGAHSTLHDITKIAVFLLEVVCKGKWYSQPYVIILIEDKELCGNYLRSQIFMSEL